MLKVSHDTIMGSGIVFLCLVLVVQANWILVQTRKGQRLIALCGPVGALWALRSLLLAGIAFGSLLAIGVVHPIRW
ncbi:MAG: hypothetical protein NTW75_02030 [Planctomycetales bacterium]|nr:hypothetical protein [Planctomycetales bacterium]